MVIVTVCRVKIDVSKYFGGEEAPESLLTALLTAKTIFRGARKARNALTN